MTETLSGALQSVLLAITDFASIVTRSVCRSRFVATLQRVFEFV